MSNQIQILHVGPVTRSTRVLWLLEELGSDITKNVQIKPYSLLKPEEYRNDEFRAKYSTNSKFPVMVDRDLTLVEGSAINTYLLRTLAPNSSLLPKDVKEVAIYDAVNSFVVGHVDEQVFSAVLELMTVPKDKINVANMTFWKKEFDDALPFFERRLTSNEYLVSNTFTAADINVVLTFYFAHTFLGWLDGHSKLQSYLNRVTSRPSWAKLKIEEGVQSMKNLIQS